MWVYEILNPEAANKVLSEAQQAIRTGKQIKTAQNLKKRKQLPNFSIRIPSPYYSIKFTLIKPLPLNSLRSRQGVKKAKQVSSQRHLIPRLA